MPNDGALKCCPDGQCSFMVHGVVTPCRARREISGRLAGMALAL